MDELQRVHSRLKPVLYELLSEKSYISSLTNDVCKGLIEGPLPTESAELCVGEAPCESECDTGLLRGYPLHPLYTRISLALASWMITGTCPVLRLPPMFLLNEEVSLKERQQRIDNVTSKLTGASTLWEMWSRDEQKHFLVDVLAKLGLRGVLDLLGVRQTVGSADLLPPPRETLLSTFNALHSPPSKLTVGARALAKHHHRDDTAHWWGDSTGTDLVKNQHAMEVVSKVMDNAVWINIHGLPHDVKVIEMRTIEGYGARWLYNGTEFRGFLEPQMEGGHEARWRH
ncbi:hypothetical protein EMCRGX_G028579 [Ephydatia muelleri]|eukprot:Em0020g72a